MNFPATPVATSSEEQMTELSLPVCSAEIEPRLQLDSSSLDRKDFMSQMNQIFVDDTPLNSLGDISRETWVEPSDFVAVENAFWPSGYDVQYNEASYVYQNGCYSTSGTYSSENIGAGHDYVESNDMNRDNSSRGPHMMVPLFYQIRPSRPSSRTERTTSPSRRLPNPTTEPENESTSAATRRGRAHYVAEKRYRDCIDLKFLRLEKVVTPNRGSQNDTDMTPHSLPKRMNRAKILDHAHDDILNLRAEIKSIKAKLERLREAAFPDTYKFTLRD